MFHPAEVWHVFQNFPSGVLCNKFDWNVNLEPKDALAGIANVQGVFTKHRQLEVIFVFDLLSDF